MADTSTPVLQDTSFSNYTPTNWACGDMITTDKLNKVENGVSALGLGTFVIGTRVDSQDPLKLTFDKTTEEILEAMKNGILPVVGAKAYLAHSDTTIYTFFWVVSVSSSSSLYSVEVYDFATRASYNLSTFSLDEYPVLNLN